MSAELLKDIPTGDLKLYDNFLPALKANNWFIQVDQVLTHNQTTVNSDTLSSLQEFIVTAPQFSVPPVEIMNKYPPAGSSGRYGEVLPHMVFKQPLLPWERKLGTQDKTPWLALLVFTVDELMGGTNSPTHAQTTTIKDFLTPNAQILKPTLIKEDDIPDTDSCQFIQISTTLFKDILPRLSELPYLAHCRQVNTGDKAILGLDEHGLFSVVMANRFPAIPAEGEAAVKNVVHLVSLEGYADVLTDTPNFDNYSSVALLSLASWSFQALPDHKEDFRGLMLQMVASETSGGTVHPEKLWLRVPPGLIDTATPAGVEAAKRLGDGFVPLGYHTRTGEDSFAWYRGPLTPLRTTAIQKNGPFLTADSALIYDKTQGVFDFSLAAAWEIGRASALSNKTFGQKVLDFRRKIHLLTDQLLDRLQSDHFSQNQIQTLGDESTIQDAFIKVLGQQLLTDIGGTVQPGPGTPTAATGDTDPKTALANFLARKDVQAKIKELVADDLENIAQWLGKLMLLYPLPFDYLVSDPRMLPVESIRFFYVDPNWVGALLDGALALGLESSRQTFCHEVTHGLLHDAAKKAAAIYRSHLLGVEPPPASAPGVICGLLMRSAVVAGWPNLAVRPFLNNGNLLKVLRMDHLSPNVLLCLYDGVPDYVEISEPQEGFRFGVDDDGMVVLRNLIKGTTDVGQQILSASPFAIRDLSGAQQRFMRSKTSRVLNLEPNTAKALIQSLKGALNTAMNTTLTAFGPADFALQMVKAPEAIKFHTAQP